MKDKLAEKKFPYAFLYVCATFICLSVVFGYVSIRGGGALSGWFFCDRWDTGNDFFNCIPAVKGYGLGYWLVGQYPPLAKLFFLFQAHIYSYDNIPLDTAVRNSVTDPRMQQAALVPFILFILFASIIIVVLVSGMYRDEKQSVWVGVSVIGTYSVLFAIERGNIILLSFLFLIYFIAHYQSENKVLRETALISLALSAGLKLYPAAFGILLLYEKRWKESVRAILYGILALIIPYVLTKAYLPAGDAENTANSVIDWAKGLLSGLFNARPIQHQIFFSVSIIIALIGMIVIGIKGSRKQWINTFYAGVLAMICGVQFAYPYTYVFLIPALVIFLKEEKEMNRKNNIYFVLMSIINLPLPIFGPQKYATLPLVGESKMWVLFIMMILITVMEFSAWKRKE